MARRPRRSELLASERVVANFFHRSNIGLAVVDAEYRYLAVNSCLAIYHGVAPELHLGKHLREILGTTTGAQVEGAVKQVLTTKKPIINHPITGPLPSRPRGGHWIDNLFPILDSNGKVEHVGIVVVEVEPTIQVARPQNVLSPPAVLRSWKDIAGYVGACVRTVQRWEDEQGFPVHRVTQSKGAVVFALRDEVNQWLETRASHVRQKDS